MLLRSAPRPDRPALAFQRETFRVGDQTIGKVFLEASQQPEVGLEGYDAGAKTLTDFFHEQIQQFQVNDLQPRGKEIIRACLDGASPEGYAKGVERIRSLATLRRPGLAREAGALLIAVRTTECLRADRGFGSYGKSCICWRYAARLTSPPCMTPLYKSLSRSG
ncbi:MAG: DUF4914 family protein [Planctomycetota bacterium]